MADFDYDDAVTTNDYFLIDNAFLGQTGALAAAGAGSVALGSVAPVPEPIGVVSLVVAGALSLRRHRRRLSQFVSGR